MRTLIGIAFAAAMTIMAADEAGAQGFVQAGPKYQPIYPTASVAGITPPGAYAFKNEPVMSINNSYLGYSNFVDPTYPAPRTISGHAAAQSPGYAPVTQQQRGARWLGWRRRGR